MSFVKKINQDVRKLIKPKATKKAAFGLFYLEEFFLFLDKYSMACKVLLKADETAFS